MFLMNVPWKPQVSGGTLSITNTDNRADNSGLATITYNAGGDPSIGAADSNRVVVVAIGARDNTTTVSSVTIAGVSATQVSGAAGASGGSILTDIWYASVPTGTTATVTIVYTGAPL